MNQVPVIFGEVLFDCFEDGSRVLGGAPFNVAWHLQGLGFEPLFISRIGSDAEAEMITTTMEQWGMATAGVQHDPERATGRVTVHLVEGQPEFEIVADCAYDHIDSSLFPEMEPELIYHGSLGVRQPVSAAALDHLLQRFPGRAFVDVNLRSPWWTREQLLRLLQGGRWLKINDQELDLLEAGEGSQSEKVARLQSRYGPEWLLLTRGAEGATLFSQNSDPCHVRPQGTIEVVDTVGAGDAFTAVTIAGLLRRWPLALTLERAQQFASRVVAQRGATIADPLVYQKLLQQWAL
ncbi:MAG: carbohydrate kinase [Gammaproteobacteria bacterium]|nr:carbohydrate kinase [Gammaproteobacteria bacterium]